jgi:uncharacterized protein (TIGR02594 family)
MSGISRAQFVESLAGRKLDLDDPTTQKALNEAGVSDRQLGRIAGRDGVIATRGEYDRLFDALDDHDRDGSRHTLGREGSKPGAAATVLLAEARQQQLDARLGAPAGWRPATVPMTPPSSTKASTVARPGGEQERAGAAPWLEVVRGELGQRETRGAAHNPRILEYHASTKLRATSDETPWCASFVNWTMKQAGVQGTDSARALSWAKWGQPIDRPAVGAVAVIDWGGGKGHVGFVVGRSGDRVVIAGGNQGNEVTYSTYRLDQIQTFRVPDGYVVPPVDFRLPQMNVKHANESIASTR